MVTVVLSQRSFTVGGDSRVGHGPEEVALVHDVAEGAVVRTDTFAHHVGTVEDVAAGYTLEPV